MKSALNLMIFFAALILSQGCKKLELQKSFEFDENDHPSVAAPFNMSIYEFMASRSEFSMMTTAVQRAAMESVFSGGEDNKTVLLLRNEAMQEFLSREGYATLDDVPVEILQKLLKYHVITTRFTQRDLRVQFFYQFQTLLEGDAGLINIWKFREYWIIRINSGGENLPSTAKSADVYLHNYEFKNGVAHHMTKYVKRAPF